MNVRLEMPESIAHSIRLPQPEIEKLLRRELAIALYGRGILSLGKASELAGISRYLFADLIGDRDIPRHCSEHELAQDSDYARG